MRHLPQRYSNRKRNELMALVGVFSLLFTFSCRKNVYPDLPKDNQLVLPPPPTPPPSPQTPPPQTPPPRPRPTLPLAPATSPPPPLPPPSDPPPPHPPP